MWRLLEPLHVRISNIVAFHNTDTSSNPYVKRPVTVRYFLKGKCQFSHSFGSWYKFGFAVCCWIDWIIIEYCACVVYDSPLLLHAKSGCGDVYLLVISNTNSIQPHLSALPYPVISSSSKIKHCWHCKLSLGSKFHTRKNGWMEMWWLLLLKLPALKQGFSNHFADENHFKSKLNSIGGHSTKIWA